MQTQSDVFYTSTRSLSIPGASIRFWRIVQLSEKQLPANPAVGRLKKMVEKVKHTVPVIADLRSGTLTARHWDLLDDVLNVDIRTGKSVTFKQMIEVGSAVYEQLLYDGSPWPLNSKCVRSTTPWGLVAKHGYNTRYILPRQDRGNRKAHLTRAW